MNLTRVRWLLAAALAAGCGGRGPFWESPIASQPLTFDLGTEVALVDQPADRVVLLSVVNSQGPSPNGQRPNLTATTVPLGSNVLNAATSADGKKLFVVSGGRRAELGDDQPTEPPSVTVIDADTAAPQRYDLTDITDPLAGLAIDPGGHWLVLYPSNDANQPFVENPNELVVLDVSQPPPPSPAGAATIPHTLKSFGGHPQRFTFTPPLSLPIGPHPLLVVESDQGLSLLQLDDPSNPSEITVPLTNRSDTQLLSPAGVTVYPGDASNGAAIGVRLSNDNDVVALQFVANLDAGGNPIGNGFLPTVNLNDVGGIASDIAFVHTDSGLRLAALIPAQSKATLIDPVTSLTEDVALPAPYQNLSVVTDALGNASGCNGGTSSAGTPTDVALLWNGSTQQGQEGVAFWELGQAGCQPFRSIDTIGITDVVAGVLDVPTPNTSLKVLQTRNADAFYILNLANRTAAPLETGSSDIALSVSPLGEQVWTFVPGGTTVFATDFAHEVPRSLLIERPVAGVYEVVAPAGDPAVIVLHDEGGVGATVYDAFTLADSTRRLYAGLLLGGAP
ncbi:MAG TPA: hypothetical protein VN853_00945 [Polyangia bacterium]|jgi:hypothetical protein|nr:hypothetical protein [Polyangia bacterium]